MKILGLNFGHDAGVSLITDGVFVGHWEKERHSRVKHAMGLTGRDIAAALEYLGVNFKEIDRVALCTSQEVPLMLYDGIAVEFRPNELTDRRRLDALIDRSGGFYARFKNNLRHEFGHYLASLEQPPQQEIRIRETSFPFVRPQREADFFTLSHEPSIPVLRPKAHLIELRMTFAGVQRPGVFVSHHFCHAFYAYSQLGRGNALIVTFDGAPGVGSFIAGGVYFGQGGRVIPVAPHDFLFGFFYDAVGIFLGLGPEGASGKLMGLAAWGEPRYQVPNIVAAPREAHSYFDMKQAGFASKASMVRAWTSKTSIPVPSSQLRHCEIPPEADADIAASAQAIFTANVLATVEASIAIAKTAKFGYDHIVLSGGCALNCPANSAVFERFGPNVFIPPAVNDEGNSAGAGLCCASFSGDSILSGSSHSPTEVAYKGNEYPIPADFLAAHAGLESVEGADASKFLAAEIARGAVVAVFEGRAEIGPRALGHRSLIASPLVAENAKKMNKIKDRELWRPLAPVVLDTEFDRHFEGCPYDSYYMLFNAKVRSSRLPAITHQDGTARVQVATVECGFIYRLLEAFRDVTGIGVLLNTSFNRRGEPIVETPAQAIEAFMSMPLDFIYLQGIVLRRASAEQRHAPEMTTRVGG